jgi:hypothetical protein
MKRAIVGLMAFLASGLIFAQSIDERLSLLVPQKVAAELSEKGVVQRVSYRQKGQAPSLAPSLGLASEAISFWEGDEPPFISETLYLYKKADASPGNPGIRDISRILRSISRLEGIEYYSTSRKKMRTLYEKSWAVDGAKTRARIPDPVEGSADGKTVFAMQKDLTFGEYVYRYEYRETQDTVAFYSRNEETLSYAIFDLVDAGSLRTSLVVHDMGDYLLTYNLTKVRFAAIPGIESKVRSSFTTRAQAVYEWFIREYEIGR